MSPAHNRDNAEAQAAPEGFETEGVSRANPDRDDKIRRRAYEIYVERGENPGCELDDRLQAERELDATV